jgi:hypothetical protein
MPPPCRPLVVKRAANGQPRFIQNVGVNHRGGDVFVPEQFLDGTNIVAVFQQVRGKAVPKSVPRKKLRSRGFMNRVLREIGEDATAALDKRRAEVIWTVLRRGSGEVPIKMQRRGGKRCERHDHLYPRAESTWKRGEEAAQLRRSYASLSDLLSK